ncbi:6-bladed beta-propeller [Aquiflexum gelatinilyticum]|uniref:6-bladed beta-propeller n=1 Tax=Aquiflexum gelatinilyticum TaxID=2961943 RepID=UPI002168E227|nr:6-bladed beta-propeller [Aquiflexum gelatinilyticum]MCS4436578.1 6-bladed beta-propeller [Aquiflexum gelatinilyticum]
MRLLPLLLFALVMILTVSCKEGKKEAKVIEEVDQTDFKAMHTVFVKTEIEIENLFEIEEIIPLDVPDGETLVSIYRLQTFEGNYYLLDLDFGTLLKFSPEGKALAKIGKLGEGPSELLDYSDFALSKSGKELLVVSMSGMSLSFFDLEGNFKRKIRLKSQSEMIGVDKDRNIGMSITYFNEDFYNFETLDSSGTSVNKFFPFPKGMDAMLLRWISGHISGSEKGGFLYHEPANSVIFEINGAETFPKYQFESNEPMWPTDKKHQVIKYFESLASGQISFLTRFFEESESHLFFTWNKKKRAIAEKVVDYRTGVYDKSTKQTYITKENSLSEKMAGPMAVEGNSVLFSISLYQLLEIAEEPILKKHMVQIQKLKKEKGDTDSPVILKMKLKELE